MTTALIEAPNTEGIQQATSITEAKAAEIVVDSQGSFESASLLLVGIKRIRRTIAETFDSPIKQAHLAHKEMVAAKKKHDGPLDWVERIVKGKLGVYSQQQERIAREEQQEKEREAREAEETRRLAEAEALEKEGRTEEADQVIEQPIVVAVAPAVPKPKAAGISTTKHYSFAIEDYDAIPRQYMMPNEKLIGQIVRAQHEAAEKLIPGIKVNVTTSVSARSA